VIHGDRRRGSKVRIGTGDDRARIGIAIAAGWIDSDAAGVGLKASMPITARVALIRYVEIAARINRDAGRRILSALIEVERSGRCGVSDATR